jgi:DnaJ homolog subfamily C member 28
MNEPNVDWIAVVAERKIQEAMDAGVFDNLELAGQPINLDENPFETAEQRIAAKILRNARALPEWIQIEQDIRREMEAVPVARERGLRAVRFAKNAPSRARAAERLRADLRERMDVANTMLLKYNMNAPVSAQRPFRQFKIKQELIELDEAIAAVERDVAGAS